MSQPDTTKVPFSGWDKNKTYISPSKDIIRIYLDGEWKAFYSQEEVTRLTDAAVKSYEIMLKNKKEEV
jgi:hypothetical protein